MMNYEQLLEKCNLDFFEKLDFEISNFKADIESHNYNACSFQLNSCKIHFRKANITPTKSGQFVTFWKRFDRNPIAPFDSSDDFDLVIIYVKSENNFGQFVFPKLLLIEKGIISTDIKEGKRGFRVYPIWEKAENKQAIQTQKWQLNYFIELPFNKIINVDLAHRLYPIY